MDIDLTKTSTCQNCSAECIGAIGEWLQR